MPSTCSPGPTSLYLWIFACAPVPSTCATEYVLSRIEAAVLDLEVVAVERAHRRAGGAVALGVVLAAVARAAEAGGHDGHERDLAVLPSSRVIVFRPRIAPLGPFACTGQPRCAQRFEMIVKLGTCLPLDRERAVVADERRAARDLALARVEHERRDVPLPLGEVGDRAEVDLVALLAEERRQEREAGDRHGDDAADHGRRGRASRPRGTCCAGSARRRRRGAGVARRVLAGGRRLAALRLDRDRPARAARRSRRAPRGRRRRWRSRRRSSRSRAG